MSKQDPPVRIALEVQAAIQDVDAGRGEAPYLIHQED